MWNDTLSFLLPFSGKGLLFQSLLLLLFFSINFLLLQCSWVTVGTLIVTCSEKNHDCSYFLFYYYQLSLPVIQPRGISFVCFFFSPFTVEHPGDVGLHSHRPPFRSSALPRQPPVASRSFSCTEVRLVLNVSSLRVGSSFRRWFSSALLPACATWLASLARFLLLSAEISRVLHLLAVLQAGLASWACLWCKCTGPSSQKGLRLGFDAL